MLRKLCERKNVEDFIREGRNERGFSTVFSLKVFGSWIDSISGYVVNLLQCGRLLTVI
jgi:hypothetical protein